MVVQPSSGTYRDGESAAAACQCGQSSRRVAVFCDGSERTICKGRSPDKGKQTTMRLEEASDTLHGLDGIDNTAWGDCREDEDLAGMSSLIIWSDAVLWSPLISFVKEAVVRKRYLGKLRLVDIVSLPVVVG